MRCAVCLGAALVLAGCSFLRPVPPMPTAMPPAVISLPIHASSSVHMAAIRGVLVVDGECLFLTGDGSTRVGIAWPAGSSWSVAAQAVVVNGVSSRVGETVLLSGGAYDPSPEDIEITPWIAAPVPECLGDKFWLAGSIATLPNPSGPNS
jgi:hypothetical protein